MTDEDAPFHAQGVFTGLTREEGEEILAAGSPISFPSEAAIFRSGDHGDAMYVITKGAAKVEVGGRFHILHAGDFFGEMALLAPGPRMATIVAEGDVETVRIPAEAFERFVLEHPAVAVAMMKQLVIRLREVEQRIDAWMA
ncbi:MAG TPA: cyclic nucleotide-binding domain-containing protein [Actinomycetota bacterium]|nr:cyclic nucleotide-binding domain-containing protein [Actinomycetota bacterium]